MQNLMKALKRKMNTGKMCNTAMLSQVVSGFSCVSFDIFDTLLKRNVAEPSDVFTLIELELGSQYEGYKKKRMAAEKVAREKKQKAEVTIYDIYKEYQDLSNEEIEYLIKNELKMEAKVLTANVDIMPLYKECIDAGKRVFLVSDIYLPKEFIVTTLTRAGITKYVELYLSCDKQQTKQAGGLFEFLLSEQKIEAKELIHIGDSFHSDYKVPQRYNIRAIHIPRIVNRSQYSIMGYDQDIRLNCLNAFINNTVLETENQYYRFGYKKFGMFLWGYARWLYDETQKHGIERLYFFSRDGLIMKKAFDICNTNLKVKTYYLEVSRRSLRVPILWMDCDFKTVLDMLSPSKLISLNTIFDGAGLNIGYYRELLAKYGFNMESTFDRSKILDNTKLMKLYEELKSYIIEVSQKEYALLKGYVDQNHLSGKFAIIDIGWSGGMQRYLEQTLTKMEVQHMVYGYYIGVAPYFKRNVKVLKNLNLNGYLFDCKSRENDTDKRSCFVGLFETLFLEQGGSVKNYRVTPGGNKIIANRYPYEYIQNGKPTEEYLRVQEIQRGALDFINHISADLLMNTMPFSADELFSGIRQTGASPTNKDLELFAKFRFCDEGETKRLADPKGLVHYLFNIKELKRDFLMSRWKIGFMKKMFKVKLPYETMYRLLLKLR